MNYPRIGIGSGLVSALVTFVMPCLSMEPNWVVDGEEIIYVPSNQHLRDDSESDEGEEKMSVAIDDNDAKRFLPASLLDELNRL